MKALEIEENTKRAFDSGSLSQTYAKEFSMDPCMFLRFTQFLICGVT
jgi:hypothetical protein